MSYKKATYRLVYFSLIGILLISTLSSCTRDRVSSSKDKYWHQADSLLALMTLEEKAGQMLNVGLASLLEGDFYSYRDTLIFDQNKLETILAKYGAGSVQNLATFPMTPIQWRSTIQFLQDYVKDNTRLGIPILYGIDAVHGANYTAGSVMTPHQINLAASFNPDLAKQAGKITAYELKVSGIPWNYAPVLDVARHPMWGRMFESFGEDTYLTTEMGAALIEGLQSHPAGAGEHVIACAKHFIGYGAAYNGKDRSPVSMSEREIRQVLLPPFQKAIEQGLYSIMVSSGSLNGVPSHIDKALITDLLKNELGFEGIVISDWNDIEFLWTIHKVADSEREAVKMAVNAGLDMVMHPYNESFAKHLIDLVKDGEVSIERVDDAVRRILYVKFMSGIFEDPLFTDIDPSNFSSTQSDEANYQMAVESITLLKNNNTLPLSRDKKLLVTGVASNSLNYLNGGWSRTWGGEDTAYNDKDKLTIYEAFLDLSGPEKIKHVQGTSYLEELDIPVALSQAKKSDVIIACLGEKPATEKPSDIEDMDMPNAQIQLVKELAKSGKPIVLVLLESRPRVIREIEPLCDAIVLAYLPGNEGGKAIADIVYGTVSPSGRLPYTYPRYSGSLWTYDHQLSDERDVHFGIQGFTPQYQFGHGLSYSQFNYSNLSIDKDTIGLNDTLEVRFTLKNTGQFEGKESALLFLSDEVASVAPPVKQLKRFTKILLKPGEAHDVHFHLTTKDLEFVNQNNTWVSESGFFTLRVDNLSARFYYSNTLR